jgi:uncharacterized membrane protein
MWAFVIGLLAIVPAVLLLRAERAGRKGESSVTRSPAQLFRRRRVSSQ